MKTKIAAVQMCSGPDLNSNLAQASQLVAQAAEQGAQLVLLPEYFCLFGYTEADKFAIAETEGDGLIQNTLRTLALKHNITLAGGTLPLRLPHTEKVSNTLFIYAPDGEQLARYDKLHLFSFRDGEKVLDEGRTMHAGNHIVTAATPVGKLGLSICYDLRFPELFRAMGEIDIMLMPAAFTATTGKAHWEVLLRARAIENQCYVLASGQSGGHSNGRDTFGHSMIINPWGEVLDCLPSGSGIVIADYDTTEVTRVRHQLQALQHKRLAMEIAVRPV